MCTVISCVFCSKLIHPDLGSIDDVLEVIEKVSTKAPGRPIDDVLDIIKKVSTESPESSKPIEPPSPAPPPGRSWPQTTDSPFLHPSTKYNFNNAAESIFKKIFEGMQNIFSSNFFPFMGMKTDGRNGFTIPNLNQEMFQPFQPLGVSTKKRPPKHNQGKQSVHGGTSFSKTPANNKHIHDQGIASISHGRNTKRPKQDPNLSSNGNNDHDYEYDFDPRKDKDNKITI